MIDVCAHAASISCSVPHATSASGISSASASAVYALTAMMSSSESLPVAHQIRQQLGGVTADLVLGLARELVLGHVERTLLTFELGDVHGRLVALRSGLRRCPWRSEPRRLRRRSPCAGPGQPRRAPRRCAWSTCAPSSAGATEEDVGPSRIHVVRDAGSRAPRASCSGSPSPQRRPDSHASRLGDLLLVEDDVGVLRRLFGSSAGSWSSPSAMPEMVAMRGSLPSKTPRR
jgi:hypothetical protein